MIRVGPDCLLTFVKVAGCLKGAALLSIVMVWTPRRLPLAWIDKLTKPDIAIGAPLDEHGLNT